MYDRYLDEKKRKNKLKKQGLWDEVRRRDLLDEEDDADVDNQRGGGGKRSSGGGGDGVGLGVARRRANQDDEDTVFPGMERIRSGLSALGIG